MSINLDRHWVLWLLFLPYNNYCGGWWLMLKESFPRPTNVPQMWISPTNGSELNLAITKCSCVLQSLHCSCDCVNAWDCSKCLPDTGMKRENIEQLPQHLIKVKRLYLTL